MSERPSPTQLARFDSARKDGQAVRQEASTYMSDKDAERFCEVMAQSLDSGLGYARILDFLARRGLRGSIVSRLREALLQQGSTLPDALARFGILDPTARKLILVGEVQGTLPEVFTMQAPLYARRYAIRQEIVSTLIEPVGLFYVATCILSPILANALTIYSSQDNVLLAAMGLVAEPALWGLIPVAIALAAAVMWIKTPVDFPPRDAFFRVWMPLPLLGIAARLGSVARFSRLLYTAVRTGMPIYDGLRLAAEASNNHGIVRKMPLVLEAIEQGVSLQDSLAQFKVLPTEALDYIGIGEETGRLEEMLEKCAGHYDAQASKASEKTLKAVVFCTRILCIFGPLGYIFLKQISQYKRVFDDIFSTF